MMHLNSVGINIFKNLERVLFM